jgi:hypothetical protein
MTRKRPRPIPNGKGRKNVRRSGRSPTKTQRLKLLVGEPWPTGITAYVDGRAAASRTRRDKVGVFLVYAFVVLFFVLTGWAMVTGNNNAMGQILATDRVGLGFAVAWVGGNIMLKVLARIGGCCQQVCNDEQE